MKAIVSGGAGFIGAHLVDALINRGDEVHIIDNLHSGHLEALHPRATVHVMDGSSPEIKDLIVRIKPDVVFHLADHPETAAASSAPSLNSGSAITIDGTIHLLEGCRLARVNKVIFASTAAVYGDPRTDLIAEKDPPRPTTKYGWAKLAEESYIRLFNRIEQLPYTILRYASVFGPRQHTQKTDGVISSFINQIKKGEPLTVFGDGTQSRDFIYVKDIVRANLAAVNHGDGEVIHISTSLTTTINQLIEMLEQIHGSRLNIIYTDPNPADVRHIALDNTKAKQLLHFSPIYSLMDGLRKTYAAEVLNKDRFG
ncbi:NAD-dependent epimerase/dehydratase family protein [Sporolactobacillus terrae]|uniref:UDP-glucose 4-epimerase n=1 Tax=Sporolactobacillus terrae TaxID=269673 RepID=A0ABX5QAX0_9BACL|nr:NAD-dependent epimerase/dehydratase family protein [Sporolactobacillus terrae]QAA23823.1 UDP-glucose 4-epimerase [Sporolactobacillus terrae]QAA26794.1 UDP-glucose 4-epimerase [Sporolactobacillus terrae]UAK15857.1 NAD-dependent epimerase/dehydratase family protein [Sporolactobacillus terrae]